MTAVEGPPAHDEVHADSDGRRGWGPEVLVVAAVATVVLRLGVAGTQAPTLRLWSTVFVSISLQAIPFLVLGVLVSAALASLVPPEILRRLLPRRMIFAVPAAGLAGIAMPGCECGSVPIAGRLVQSGVPPAAALTFLLAAPAVNPVVLVATAVAFPSDHRMVVGRFVASLVAACVVGGIWAHAGVGRHLEVHEHGPQAKGRVYRFVDAFTGDLLHAGGFLVLGASAAATIQITVPSAVLDTVADHAVTSVIAMAVLAVVISICSEADAFVAAAMPQFSLTARLVFLVVGPMIDLKLFAMQVGVFGRRFALRFAPLTLLVCVVCALAAAASVGL